MVITTSSAPRDRVEMLAERARVIVAGEHSVELGVLMSVLLNDLEVRRLVVEGGPTLNSRLIAAGMADELFWSVSPQILGGPAVRTMVEESPMPVEGRPDLRLVSVYRHESELFLRYRFVHPTEA